MVIATGAVTTVVGSPRHAGVLPGQLPARLGKPVGLAVLSTGDLAITDDQAVLVARF